ncbi:ferredoxin reductase family protein [Gryllotalpicola sp.]|uniref:ferredoxin reductase family protein n=1 Tax=Gryllotalpicola sp. TaxID=1932787 RepID=UPI002634CA6A|nr:ferredoxin reductase family protein [Gryllotalpicola sp.]
MGRIALRTLITLGGIGVLALWWTGAIPGFTATPALTVTTFGELVGLIAGYLVCVQVLLIARIPWFERGVGLDRLVSWHRSVGTTVIFLVMTHIAFMMLGGMLADGKNPVGEYISILSAYQDMWWATIGTLVFFVVGLTSARLLKSLLPYEWWYWIHVTTYIAIFLTFLHQVSSGTNFVAHPVPRAIWILMYVGTALCVVWWRALLPLVRFARHDWTVATVVPESPRAVSVWIKGNDIEDLGIRAGNFMMFRFLTWRHIWSAHPYSISAPPYQGHLRITVADLGNHSGALRDIRPGTKVIVEGPHGSFTAERAKRQQLVLIAGGAGIGPIAALARDFAGRGFNSVVIYRARDVDDMALLDEVRGLPGTRLIVAPGRRSDLGFDPLAPEHLSSLVPDIRGREAFLCGPEPMMDTATHSLHALGVRRIHAEEMSFA